MRYSCAATSLPSACNEIIRISNITALGFTSAGIAAGSLGTSAMSAAAIANGGGVAAGSMVSYFALWLSVKTMNVYMLLMQVLDHLARI